MDAENGNYSLKVLDPKEGQYTCNVEEKELKNYDITVWTSEWCDMGIEEKGNSTSLFLPLLVGWEEDKGKPGITRTQQIGGCLFFSFTVKGPQQKYFLPGEALTLSLEQRATVAKHTKAEVKWFSPRKVNLAGTNPRWQLRNNNWKLQIDTLSAEEDSGTWECHIPLEDGLKVSYNITVIGRRNH